MGPEVGAGRRVRPASILALVVALVGGCDRRTGDLETSQIQWIGDTLVTTFLPSQSAALASVTSSFPRKESAFSEQLGRIGVIAASATGTVAFFDADAKQLWVVANEGAPPTALGRAGDGPGEYRQVSAVAFLPDGGIVAVDAWSGRRLLYDASGDSVSSQRISTSSAPQSPSAIVATRDGKIATRVSAFEAWRRGQPSLHGALILDTFDGASADTLLVPASVRAACPTVPEPRFRSGFIMDIREPFVLKVVTGVSPLGEMVTGCPLGYRFEFKRGAKVYHFVAPHGEIPTVPPAVVERHRASWTRSKRLAGADPNFSWSGAGMVDRYPSFFELLHDHDRRIIAVAPVSETGGDVAVSSNAPRSGRARPPLAFDFFDIDGGYCGRVRLPQQATYDGSPLTPPPVFRGDTVWAVMADSTGHETIGRMNFQLEGCDVG